jgi:subtilase family serine protease
MKSLLAGSVFLFSVLGLVFPATAAPPLKVLHGHVPAAARRQQAIGNVSTTQELNLAIGLPLRDTNGLQKFLDEVYDPASTNYGHYLTPEEFAKRFGPSESDYAAVMAFAKTNHLKLTHTHGNRMLLDVSGSVGDIQNAFHIVLHTYTHPTEARNFFAPDTEPTVDGALPILDISGLSDYGKPRPKSLHQDSVTNIVTPRTGSGSNGGYIGNDFRAAYFPGVTLTGAGQQIGMIEFDGFYSSDITSYETAAKIPAVPIQTVLLEGYNGIPTTGTSSGNPEVSLDIEVAMAMAPGLSKIVVFEAGPDGFPNDVLNAMAASNSIKSLSCSWGWSGGPSATTDNIFKQMAAQGQSFFSASGDSDAFTAGSTSANGVDNPSLNNFPSSSPYITQVGGTTLATTGPGGAWASEKVWNWGLRNGSYVGSSGGISSYYPIPNWQTNIGFAANGASTKFRNTPDVALTADNVYVTYGNGGIGAFGGTSCAAPLWAAVAALMNEQAAAGGRASVGFINPAIYRLSTNATYAATFHDITTGNNASDVSPNGFYAVTGYDLCTGLGTPAGGNLITALAGVNTLTAAAVPSVYVSGLDKSGGTFSFSWSSSVGVTYQVQYKTNLLQANWSNLGATIPGTGLPMSFADTNAAASDPQRFYRLVVSSSQAPML